MTFLQCSCGCGGALHGGLTAFVPRVAVSVLPAVLDPPVVIEEPLTLEEVKAHCKIEHDLDDALLATYLAAARQYIEEDNERTYAMQTWAATITGLPSGASIVLPRGPVEEIALVESVPPFPATERVELTGWTWVAPTLYAPTGGWPAAPDVVVVTYVAGVEPAAVPPLLRHAMLVLTGLYYASREASAGFEVPQGLRDLIARFRIGTGVVLV